MFKIIQAPFSGFCQEIFSLKQQQNAAPVFGLCQVFFSQKQQQILKTVNRFSSDENLLAIAGVSAYNYLMR